MALPVINPGSRALGAGRTGSGKSTWGKWMLQRSPLSWVILNPKHTAAYKDLPESVTIKSLNMRDVEKALSRNQYVIVNPESADASPDSMDDFVMALHNSFSHVGLCCDELYSLHKGGVAGQGLIGYLTRGRELKQSFLGLTQRPAWLSQFLFSESDYICGMALALEKDRKRMVEMTGKNEFLARVPPRNWLWYDVAAESLAYYGPVPI